MTIRLATAAACAAGCLQPGHTPDCGPTAAACDCSCHRGGTHRPPCDVDAGCGPHTPDPSCRGCRPRPATAGVLCERCWARLTSALALAPDLVTHLRSCLLPGSGRVSTRGEERHTKGVHAALPINADAIDYADLIYSLLVAEVGHAADALDLTGFTDDPRVWRATTNEGRATGARTGAVAGLAVGATGREARPYAVWLFRHLDAIGEHDWAVDLVSDRRLALGSICLSTAVHRAARAFPLEEQPALIPLVRCPACELRALVRNPPSSPDLPVVVTCTQESCGWTGTDEHLGLPAVPTPRRSQP